MYEWFGWLRRVVLTALGLQGAEGGRTSPEGIDRRKHIVLPLAVEIIAGIVILLVPLAFSGVRTAIARVVAWLRLPVSVPCWLFLLLCVLAIVFVLQNLMRRRKGRQVAREPRVEEYKSDKYDGMVWRWEWADTGGIDVKQIHCYCLSCDRRLLVDEGPTSLEVPGGSSQHTRLNCQECGQQKCLFGPYHREQLMAKYEFELKIRNGSWRQVLLGQRTP